MFSHVLRPAIVMLALFTVLTGVVYPLVVTAFAQVAFSKQANGSLVVVEGKAVASELVGQPFDSPRYFWSRPSATGPFAYNAAASSGSNLGPSEPKQHDAVKARVEALRASDPSNSTPIPIDLVTASASGLDPHISPAAALYQVPRVARERNVPESAVRDLVNKQTEPRTLGFLGEARVNVVLLNLALDKIE